MSTTPWVRVQLTGFRPVTTRCNAYIGVCSVALPDIGIEIFEIAIFFVAGRVKVQIPARPILDETGTRMLGPDGKALYVRVLRFIADESQKAFEEAVIAQ